MSRKARAPIQLPKDVEAKAEGKTLMIKGPKGVLSCNLRKEIVVSIDGDKIRVSLEEKKACATNFLGLFWALIANNVKGVSEGFEKRLELVGVGYRASVQGKELDLLVGFSHPTKMVIPHGIEVVVEKNTVIQIKGIDKQQVGEFAAAIRAKRPPEPYKGKGIRYEGEYIRRKAGKAGKAGKK